MLMARLVLTAAASLACRNTTLEKHCSAMLDAEYGQTAANMIRNAGLMEHPLRLTVNADWDNQVNGAQQALNAAAELWISAACCVAVVCCAARKRSQQDNSLP
jgi:hypothetical protein